MTCADTPKHHDGENRGGDSQSERRDATGWREQNGNSQQGLSGGKRKNVSIIDWLASVHHVRGQRRTKKRMRHKNDLFILKMILLFGSLNNK